MQQVEKKLNCEKHPESEISAIFIGDFPINQSRFLCVECILEGGEQYKQGLTQIVKIKDFFTNPSMQYRKTIYDDIETYIQEITKCTEQLAIFLKIFYQNIHTHLEVTKQNVKALRILSATINSEMEKKSKFDEVQKLYYLIKNMDSFQGTQEFKKLQEEVNTLCRNFSQLYKDSISLIKARQEQLLKDYKQSLLNIQKDLSQISAINIYTIQEINFFNMENQNDFSFILKELVKFGGLNYQLIYQGTRDGLSNDVYWQKCNLQSNLLTIITMKNGNIFGGYSPSQLDLKESWYQIQDDTMTSFVFQQNKQQIYKLKSKAAIMCDKDQGPRFGCGSDCDFIVWNNFKTITSNLGFSYDITGYNIQNQRTHLIGDRDQVVIECKVYKITYVQ